MVTYRKELERKGWHRPWPVRALFVLVGTFVILLGLIVWSFEQEMGGWEGTGLGHHSVEQDALTGRALVRNEANEVVFEGSSLEEVDAWIESQRNRNFTIPVLVIAGGGLLTLAGVAPSLTKRELGDGDAVDVTTDEELVDAQRGAVTH